MEIECVVDSKSVLGEGPLWDHVRNQLWWVDIEGQFIHRYDPETRRNDQWLLDEKPACLHLNLDGKLIVAGTNGFSYFNWETGQKTPILDPESHLPSNRFNDGCSDRQGRFWAGTMKDASPREPIGTYYRLDPDETVTKGPGGYMVTNGTAFSPDGKKMYTADTDKSVRSIYVYDYDIDEGIPYNKRLFFDTHNCDFRPDGATIDCDGCYWVAGIEGWKIVRITPQGKIDREIKLPIEKPTKPVFGGKNFDTIFVTSLRQGLSASSSQPLAGGLFAIYNSGASGMKNYS